MADEPVVVSKARPMKASNGVEDKNQADCWQSVQQSMSYSKGMACCEGVKCTISVCCSFFFEVLWTHKCADGHRHLSHGGLGIS